ncbi:hypothetical protein WJX72_009963 [[Myrmecia] bisecta]|uniref:HD/PDEase domain-containing protein n=1 Tax=[Myrmecia] bisecta TaxID=41462 RepID=A0AAW1PB37_9CHLO
MCPNCPAYPLVWKTRDPFIKGSYVRLGPVSAQVVDTREFQRLRNLKQLGFTSYVFATANHTRFEHSLGVAHRAREMAALLACKQPELGITAEDLMVVEMAGLCHDLGHGPFSHSFEKHLLPLVAPDLAWCHERMSCVMFDHLCARHDLGLTAEQQQRVKDIIVCGKEPAQADWRGKRFLFDIVANGRNGIDVDKFDYIKRDSELTGVSACTDFTALLDNMKVINDEICFKASKAVVLLSMFHARATLHDIAYTHPNIKGIELMAMDALALADDELNIRQHILNPDKFALLDDTVVREIERSQSDTPQMRRAKALLARCHTREVYEWCAGVVVPPRDLPGWKKFTAADVIRHQDPSASVQLRADDLRVDNVVIDFAMGEVNPLESVGFYYNNDDMTPKSWAEMDSQPVLQPATFLQRKVRVYLAKDCSSVAELEGHIRAVQDAFGRWEEKRQHGNSQGLPSMKPPEIRPLKLQPDRIAMHPEAKGWPKHKHVCYFITHSQHQDRKGRLGHRAHALRATEEESARMMRAMRDEDRWKLTDPEGLQLAAKSHTPHAEDVKVVILGQLFLEDPYVTGTPSILELRDTQDVADDAANTENVTLHLTADDNALLCADRMYTPPNSPRKGGRSGNGNGPRSPRLREE